MPRGYRSQDEDLMEIKHQILEEKRFYLCRYLKPETHFPYLRSVKILTKSDQEIIEHEITSESKVSKFVDILLSKGPDSYERLVQSLTKDRTQMFIVERLNREFERRRNIYLEERSSQKVTLAVDTKQLPKPIKHEKYELETNQKIAKSELTVRRGCKIEQSKLEPQDTIPKQYAGTFSDSSTENSNKRREITPVKQPKPNSPCQNTEYGLHRGCEIELNDLEPKDTIPQQYAGTLPDSFPENSITLREMTPVKQPMQNNFSQNSRHDLHPGCESEESKLEPQETIPKQLSGKFSNSLFTENSNSQREINPVKQLMQNNACQKTEYDLHRGCEIEQSEHELESTVPKQYAGSLPDSFTDSGNVTFSELNMKPDETNV